MGSYIVQALVSRGEKSVSVLDLNSPKSNERIDDVEYYTGDICDEGNLINVLNKV